MICNNIKCEAVKVKTEDKICPGMAKTREGEIYTLNARTPKKEGICINALTAIHPMELAFKLTGKMSWEKKDHFDITCPHGAVIFRISRQK